MTEVLTVISSYFWSESVWLPPGMNWTTIPKEQFTDFSVMYQSIPLAMAFICIRIGFEWIIARPLGKLCGLPDPGSELPNIFRRCYRRIKAYWEHDEKALHHISHRRVRTMSTHTRPITIMKSRLDKFCESLWRCAFYTSAFAYGLYTLWDKPWLWDASYCFDGYPYQEVSDDIKWYYLIEAAFYTSLMISQFTDVQRKDFEMMFIHHIATLALLWLSWGDNFTRVGSLILVIHDCADISLELAKCFRYIEFDFACNVVFVVFAASWFFTRCFILPYCVLYSTFIEAPALIVWFPVYYIFNSLLMVLQVLHAIWSWMILKIVYNTVVSGVVDDTRSDDEVSELEVNDESVSDDETNKNNKQKSKNNSNNSNNSHENHTK